MKKIMEFEKKTTHISFMFDGLQTQCTPLHIPITDRTDSSCLENALVCLSKA